MYKLNRQLEKKILILDGAMGTMIQQKELSIEDFGGEEYDGCNEYLNITAPLVIKSIHEAYLEAGADIIETNTFGGTPLVLDEYGLGHLSFEINKIGAELAVQAAKKYSTEQWPRFVAGSMGPTTKTLSVTGGATFYQLVENYQVQAEGLLAGGVDFLLLETSQDMLNVKAAFLGIQEAAKKMGIQVPLMLSGTIEPMGTTLAGQDIEAFYISSEHIKPFAVGLNCATGPEFMTDHIRTLADMAEIAVSCYPNAGLPDEEGHYHETPRSLAQKIKDFAEKGWLNIAGGCCGTTPDHIRELAKVLSKIQPRPLGEKRHEHRVSGIEPLRYDETMRPLFVGERTNVIGSRKFKRLISEGKYEEAAEIARNQVKNGAHVIDVCLADPDRDELHDMEMFIKEVVKKVKVPLVIDSTDWQVTKRALEYIQGKSIINSINLEDGMKRFHEIIPLMKQFGAAVVVGTIDESGMALTREQKLAVAKRSYDILVNEYGISPTDIIFDPLVFPVGTGDEQYIGSAKETVEGIRLIKETFPDCLTILGISNVSFGLPAAGREVLNAVFLYHCTQAGLDYAIVNTEKLERYASIPEEERILAEKLLFETNDITLAEFTNFYRDKKKEEKQPDVHLSLEERLAQYVVEGTKQGLIDDLKLALEKYKNPLDIINGPLMQGMDTVGKLFNDNQLIVAEVLQSAEVMKASVAFLEPYMEKQETNGKGKVLLATVKGDVHDIGKNLVDIILSNNGFRVIDLGIKVAPQTLIEAVKKEKPDIIGLSGLLVKSAQQMVLTAQDLQGQDISVPILVGGAALTRKFTENKIAPEYHGPVLYAKDAMDGLALANRLMEEPETFSSANAEKKEANSFSKVAETEEKKQVNKSDVSKPIVFQPVDCHEHILTNIELDQIIPYVNMQMLIGHHFGLKGNINKMLAENHVKAVEIKAVIDELFELGKVENWFRPSAIYRFFPAYREGNTIHILDSETKKTIIETFNFPRQEKPPYLCIADYVSEQTGDIPHDYIALFAVTAGENIRKLAFQFKEKGEFFKSHAIQAMALELAEGLAERTHQLIRDRWGFPDPLDFSMKDRFQAKYQGQRFSFGYPACPDLEDQAKLFKLLQPEKIGIQLTEGFMMEPEASVTAFVVAHPEARYFNVL